MTALLDLVLAAGLLGLAVRVVAARDDRSAIVTFLGFGLLLGLAWARLSAPDVALTEIAIGGGAAGLLLLRAEAVLRGRRAAPAGHAARAGRAALRGPASPAGRAGTALACLLVTGGLAYVVLAFPSPAPTLAPAASASLGATGLGNPVTAVLLAYRAIDTLLEKIVVLLAVAGVWSLAPDRLWGGAPEVGFGPAPEPLVYLARILPPFGVVIGIYMFWVGADEPGGTFQAGTVLAAMWLLVMMAGLGAPPETRGAPMRLALAGGPALFVAIGFLGCAVAGGFLAYPESFAKPLILVIEAVLTLSVAAALAMLVAGPARRAPIR